MSELQAKPSATVRWTPVAFGFAVSALVHFGVGALHVVSGEPLLLRWLRVLADHPVRAGLATTLLVVALSPRADPPATPTRSVGEEPGPRSSH